MKQLTVPAKVEHLDDIFIFIEKAISSEDINLKAQNHIITATEEIFVNIASYAYPSEDGKVSVSIIIEPGMFTVEFQDEGIPYNPLANVDPDTTLSVDEREIGGLGIFVVKKLMDNIRYRYESGKNILTLEKII